MAEPLEPVTGVCRVAVQGNANNVQIVNIFHVLKKQGTTFLPWTQAEVLALSLGMKNLFVTDFIPLLATQYVGVQVVAQDLTSITAYTSVTTFTNAGTAGSGLTMPASAAICITWTLQRRYRGGHPRTYVGPINSTAPSSPTTIAPATVTAATNSANHFIANVPLIAGLSGFDFALCTVHRHYRSTKLIPPIVSQIQGAIVDTRIDSQRRRLGKDR